MMPFDEIKSLQLVRISYSPAYLRRALYFVSSFVVTVFTYSISHVLSTSLVCVPVRDIQVLVCAPVRDIQVLVFVPVRDIQVLVCVPVRDIQVLVCAPVRDIQVLGCGRVRD
jgi:hypothetical protein